MNTIARSREYATSCSQTTVRARVWARPGPHYRNLMLAFEDEALRAAFSWKVKTIP
jgi:hypothetical protein